jgi:hypothetical protein
MSDHTLQLYTLPLGQWATNCYILTCGGESLIVDPAAEPERILAAVAGTTVKAVLLTHAHPARQGIRKSGTRESGGWPLPDSLIPQSLLPGSGLLPRPRDGS